MSAPGQRTPRGQGGQRAQQQGRPQPGRGGNPGAPIQRALDLLKQGKRDEAEKICTDLIGRFPEHFRALALLGGICLRTGRHQRAAQLLTRAVAANPKAARVHNNLGEALKNLKRPQAALKSFDKAIALDPKMIIAWSNKAGLLYQAKRYAPALTCYDKMISLQPNLSRAWFNRGNCLRVLKRPVAALENYDKAIELDPAWDRAHINRGALLLDEDRCEEALASFQRAIDLKPDAVQPYYNRANALRDLNQIEEAIASYQVAIDHSKEPFTPALWNQANCYLHIGEYEKGWPGYENRNSRRLQAKKRDYKQPIWLGEEDIAGKTLLIYPELYLGDMIQFCRYAKLAEARGAKVILSAQNQLHQLLSTLSPTIEIIAGDATPEQFDFWTPLMSLPLAFKTTVETIPADVPYLHAEEERVAKWKERLGTDGFKIGICWQGTQTGYAERLRRSFSGFNFRGIAKIPGVRLISLQKINERDPADALPHDMKIETFGNDLDPGPQAFLDTAALMQSLDLIISTDTAMIHLAGMLARPAWLVVKHVPDWRWFSDRSDNPWYPTLTIFRQKTRGDWKSAFDQVEDALKAKLGV
jgi:tetratricopeptide (TPR) repeat protein